MSQISGLRSDSPADCHAAVAALNRDCACLSVDRKVLAAALAAGGIDAVALAGSRPHLFSDTVVFVGEKSLQRMADLVAAVETVVALPAWQASVLARSPAIASHPVVHPGVFLGFDFHLDDDGPRLIEINTNAGGGLLNVHLAGAQRSCCGPVAPRLPDPAVVEADFLAMFLAEWRAMRGAAPLRRVAIVDETPADQYLAPEFELFRRFFQEAGIAAVIADPQDLSWDGQELRCQNEAVDLVYNRLTDFDLDETAHAALRHAYLAEAVVLTPHPRAHALYADKRNLILLSDATALDEMGVPAETRDILLATVPLTVAVTADGAERFWSERRRWFFKPAAGFGSRAAYRGDKLTRRVFEQILAGDYIAQAIVPPSERRVHVGTAPQDLKLDLRCYAYAGRVQLVAARLYQGQTTNFRTPGGGFAAVVPVSGHSTIAP